MDSGLIWTITTWVFPVLLCIILHELAHGWVAMKLGDMTAKFSGRLTLNPKDHIDPVGTILVPGVLMLAGSPVLFGWAKPVPVDFSRLRHPKRDMGFVAAAGPAANVLLAIGFVLMWHILNAVMPMGDMKEWVFQNVMNGISLSLALAIFNLLPILPLDGGRIVSSLLPLKYSIKYQQSERYGFLILLGILFIAPMLGFNIVGWFMNALYPLFISIVQIFM